jgi:hypothetical protein
MALGHEIQLAWTHHELRSRFALDRPDDLEIRRESMCDALCN